MKTYVLTLSKTFPAKHPLAGLPTFFKTKLEIANVIPFDETNRKSVPDGQTQMKLHTIRANYPLWRNRFDEIERGEACLSLRQWSGKPYASKQIEIGSLTKEDGIGLQRLEFYNGCLQQPILSSGMTIRAESLAKNDGLSFDSWKEWFNSCDLSKPLAIIHFTKFRY